MQESVTGGAEVRALETQAAHASQVGRHEEARLEFERAARMTDNARERDLSLARARSAARAEGHD